MAATQTGSVPPRRHARLLSFLGRKPLTAARAAQIIAAVTIAVTVLSGLLIRLADARSFPDIGDGFWWAVQTVTTVGYGDIVPRSTGGRLVAALVMVVGIGFLTVMTAAITSTFVEAARRRFQSTEDELLAARLEEISSRLAAIERKLAAVGPRDRQDGEGPASGAA